jgi:hypothetical protein
MIRSDSSTGQFEARAVFDMRARLTVHGCCLASTDPDALALGGAPKARMAPSTTESQDGLDTR